MSKSVKPAAKSEIVTRAVSEVVSARPDFLQPGAVARGSENVEMSDIIIPRLEVVQPLSKCKDEDEPGYIEGAKDGMLYNTVTRELYESDVTIVPVLFRKQFLVFKKRSEGGGFRGSFDTEAAADAKRREDSEADKFEVVEAAEHFVLVVNNDQLEQAMVTCTKTKLKVSRQLNTLVQMRGVDRWACAYALGSSREKNDKGTFYNFAIRPMGFISERIYREGEKLWKAISSNGARYKGDFADLEDVTSTNPAEM